MSLALTTREEVTTGRKWLSLAVELDEEEEDDDGDERFPLHRCASPTVGESGISFQRCGGGRRVIRNTGGGY